MKAPWSRMPAVPVSAGFAAGILLQGLACFSWWGALTLAAIASVLMFGRCWRLSAFTLLAVTLGWLAAWLHRPMPVPDGCDRQTVRLSGRVASVVESPEGLRMAVVADSLCNSAVPEAPRVLLRVNGADIRPVTGSYITAKGWLRTVGVSAGNALEDDRSMFYKADGVSAMMFCSPDDLRLVSVGVGLRAAAERSRWHLVDLIYDSRLNGATADFAVGLLLGRDEFLSPDLRESFRSLGIAHLLAVSGFHVAVFAGLIALLLSPLKLTRFGSIRHLPLVAAVWGYVMMTGMTPSAVRAAIMATIVMGGHMLQRRPSPYNSLAVAAAAMLAVDPLSIYSLGFQLSFCAVLGLIAFGSAINPFERRHRWLHAAAALFCVPLAAMAGTCILTVAYFHTFPLMFLPANVLVCLLTPPFIVVALLHSLLLAFGIDFVLTADVLNMLYALCVSVIGVMSKLSPLQLDSISLSAPTLALMALTTVMAAVAVNRRRRWLGILTVAALTLTIGSGQLQAEKIPEGELYIPSSVPHLAVVCRHGSTAAYLCRSDAASAMRFSRQAPVSYARWLRSRSTVFTPADSLPADAPVFSRGDHLFCGPYIVAFVDRRNTLVSPLADVCVIDDRGIDLTAFAADHPGSRIILSPNLRRLDAEGYVATARAQAISVHNAADSTFVLSW